MRGYPGRKPSTEMTPPSKIEVAQFARNEIRFLTSRLPDDEAMSHRQLLNRSEKAIRRKKKKELQHSFTRSEFPPEIRNMIYDLLLVNDEPIIPVCAYPGRGWIQKFRRYDLGAHFLVTGKEVLREALPILLGRNTFEITAHFHYLLGNGRLARSERGKLVKKVIVDLQCLKSEWRSFGKLKSLKDCTIVCSRVNTATPPLQDPTDTVLEVQAFDDFKRLVRPTLEVFMRENRGVKFLYLHESHVKTKDEALNTAATKLKVWCTDILQYGDPRFAYEKVAVNYYGDSAARTMPLV